MFLKPQARYLCTQCTRYANRVNKYESSILILGDSQTLLYSLKTKFRYINAKTGTKIAFKTPIICL